MLKTRVIPVLLYQQGRLVKSIRFKQHRNLGNPIQTVKIYNARNVDELVILDITKTPEGKEPEYKMIKEMARECFMPLAVGGGVRSVSIARKLFLSGADKICLNSAAIENYGLIGKISRMFGSQSVIVSIDAKKSRHHFSGYQVITRCGTLPTRLDSVEWAKEVERRGAGEIFLTSIDCEGAMQGFDLELIRNVSTAVTIPVIAHGGAGTPLHCVEAIGAGASAVAAASIFHYTHTTPQMVKLELKTAGYPTRNKL